MTILHNPCISQLLRGAFVVVAAFSTGLVSAREERAPCALKGKDGNAQSCVDQHVTPASNSVLQVTRYEEDGVADIQAVSQTTNAALATSERWIVAVPSGCQTEELRSVAKDAEATGAAVIARGDPSAGGLCFLVMEGTRSHVVQSIRNQPWAKTDAVVEPEVELVAEPEIVTSKEADQTDHVPGAIVQWDQSVPATANKEAHPDQHDQDGKGAHIYVLDSGIRASHGDLKGRAIPTLEFVGDALVECRPTDTDCASDRQGGGTHLAAAAGGRVYGVAKAATVHAMKLLDHKTGQAPSSRLLRALDWLLRKGKRPAVVSLGLGAKGQHHSLTGMVNAVVQQNITVVVAADGCNVWPASVPSVIAVGASDFHDEFNDHQATSACIKLLAPSRNIATAGISSDTAMLRLSGNSIASSHVSGAAALVLAEDVHRTPGDVLRLLSDRAVRCDGPSATEKARKRCLVFRSRSDQSALLAAHPAAPAPAPPATGDDPSVPAAGDEDPPDPAAGTDAGKPAAGAAGPVPAPPATGEPAAGAAGPAPAPPATGEPAAGAAGPVPAPPATGKPAAGAAGPAPAPPATDEDPPDPAGGDEDPPVPAGGDEDPPDPAGGDEDPPDPAGGGEDPPATDDAGGDEDPPIPEEVLDKKPPKSSKAEAGPTNSPGFTRPAPGTRTTLLVGPIMCEKGQIIANNLTTSDNFQVDFDLQAYGPRPGWTGIFRITKSKQDRGHHFDRMPAFYMRPGTLDLDAVMGKDVVGHDNDLIEDPFQLKLGETHHITGRLQGDTWQLFVDGEQMHNLGGYLGTKFPPMENAEVFVTDNFYPAANVSIANLVYTVLEPDPVMDEPYKAPPKTQIPLKKEMAVGVGRLVTNRLTTGRNFEVTFNVTPTGLAKPWTTLLRITKSYTDVGHHWDRMPAFFFKPMKTELFAVMGREHEFEDNEYLETDYELPMNEMSQVVGRLQGDNWTLSVNGKVLHTLRGYKERRFPAMQNVSVWVGDRFYAPAAANISWINYTVLPDDEDGPPVTDFLPPPKPGTKALPFSGETSKGKDTNKDASGEKQKIKYGYALPDTITTGRNFEVSFDIKPTGKSEHMTSIIRLTKTTLDEGHYYDRMPGIFFYPESTLVHVVMGRMDDHQAHVNPAQDLPLNKKSRVKVRLQGDSLTININGKEEARLNGFEGLSYPPLDNVTVWVGDQFYQPAEAWLYGLNYTILSEEPPAPTPAPLPQSTVVIKNPKATGKGYLLPRRFNTTRNFQLCFAISPYGKKTVWRSIMRFTKTSADKSHYWDRMPALFFKPGSTEIRAVMGNQADHDSYVDSYSELKLKTTSRVCVRLEGDLFTLSINGVLADRMPGYCGAKYMDKTNVSVWVGDKFYDPADAELLSVNYTTLPDDIDYSSCLAFRNESTVPLGPLLNKTTPGTPLLKDPRRIQRGRLLANGRTTGRNFEVSFNITPYSTKDNLTSILRYTKSSNNKGSKFDNMPGFFFQPRSTTVLAVMGRNGKHHATVPSSKDLPVNFTSTVKARLNGDRFTLWINGTLSGVLAGFQGVAYPSNSDVLVWSGDRFNQPADASISNINYTALPSEPAANTSSTGSEDTTASDGSSESPSDGETSTTGGSSSDKGSEGDYWAGEPQGDSDTTEAGNGEGSGEGEAGDGEGSGDGEAGDGEGSGDGEAGNGEAPGDSEAPVPVPATTPAEKAEGSTPKEKPREAEVPSPDEAPEPKESPSSSKESPPSNSESTTNSPEEPNKGKSNWLALGNLVLGLACVILLLMLVCRQ